MKTTNITKRTEKFSLTPSFWFSIPEETAQLNTKYVSK